MSIQRVCDTCHEQIDESTPFFTLTGQKVKVVDGGVTGLANAVSLDFHEDHLPPGTEHFADDPPSEEPAEES